MMISWHLPIAAATLAICACASLPSTDPLSAARQQPEPPRYGAAAAPAVVWLEQNWTASEREAYHHRSQGTATLPIPLTWFMALEQPEASLDEQGLFSDPAYLDRYGFIPSARSTNNPEGLPVGFAPTRGVDPSDGRPFEQIGFTCAACHTGRFDYMGRQVFFDGGPAMIELGKFRKGLAKALAMTSLSPLRFKRFADRVLGRGHDPAAGLRLHNELARTVAGAVIARFKNPSPKGSVEEGFGRLDALNRIGNEVFADQMKQPANLAALSAPVAYPHIWDAAWFDWVQYNSSIQQPMVRNAGEAMGVRALVNFRTANSPRFTSTVPIDALHDMETLLAGATQPADARSFSGLRSPAWPRGILPSIDVGLKERGRTLYRELCSGCHLPATNEPAFWTNAAWLAPNEEGQRYLRLKTIEVATIGTDPAQADDMKRRQVRVPLAYGLMAAPVTKQGAIGVYGYGRALGDVVELVIKRWHDTRTPPTGAPERDRMAGFRPNGIRNSVGSDGAERTVYKARPLNGIWATAPFLHNGSVPTLYDLLSPYGERPKDFWLGNREFDPVKVGYRTGPIKGGFRLVAVDASGRQVRGNGNGGHLFETPATPQERRPGTIGRRLDPDERMALIEFLKSL